MTTAELQNRSSYSEKLRASRTYVYYSRYPAIKPIHSHRSWRSRLRRMGMYMRLFAIGLIAITVGGIFPVVLSYELCFKPLITVACNDCQIINGAPYFEFDYIFASVLGVFGFMMPIFVLYIFIKILRSRTFRHDIFH
jgi:hypothetical protein